MTNKQVATRILDYWFAVEFLGQDSYETCTDKSKLERELVKFKKTESAEKNKRRQISVFETIDSKTEIYNKIYNQAKDCSMSTWGNLTFFVGKIQRQVCIEKLASQLGIQLKQAEKNNEYIPVISFQCTNQGKYIEHTLSLSTIVWSLSQISENNINQISELLADKNYLKTIEEMEKKYFSVDYSLFEEKENESNEYEKNDSMPEFDVNSISVDKIIDIYNDIISEFGKYIAEDAIENNIGLKYQLFKDLKSKEKYDDDNYMGLSHDFFSSDIKMVKKNIEDGNYDFDSGMLSDIVSYICSPYYGLNNIEKYDFVSPQNKDIFLNEMLEILNMNNAPIAKWPSRYMPALMQQVAINFAISNKKQGVFEKNGHIFSVNGPPGTGKTTLLKEIIANNIVEKAIVLSKYDTPDDAFVRVNFTGGNYNGAYVPPINGGHSMFPGWFKFIDEHVADYGILVTSCNNAAVENITKELPIGSGIIDNLKAVKDGESPDSKEMQEQLGEIRKLFSTNETEERIEIYKNDNSRHGEYPEIYFTGYAQKFLGSDNEDADAWGLVAAPLGKKSNICGFYYDVLNPIWQDFMMANKTIENRIPEYRKSKEIFIKQLEKVRNMQKELGYYDEIILKLINTQNIFKKIYKENTSAIGKYQIDIENIESETEALREQAEQDAKKLRSANVICSEIEQLILEHQNKIKELSEWELEYRRRAFETEKSVTFFTKLFRKEKYYAAIELAQSYRNRAEGCISASYEESNILKTDQIRFENAMTEKMSYSGQLYNTQEQVANLEKKKNYILSEIQRLNIEIEDSKRNTDAILEEKNRCLLKYTSGGELKSGQILDNVFIEKILAKDEKISTEAQTSNPWATEEYNREREKLFFLALQMTKNFLLSSKSCRTNLCILGQYWGLRTESGSEKIQFKPEDSEKMMGSLFNTLFLLTPVISSTFASVGRLLRDIKNPGEIGTLVIDEAGQAQPQMAIGALFRSRRAVIVGDPKQVEPVVTDDLKLLKEAYSEPIYENYKNKSLSVQSCADIINPFGTFLDNGTDSPEWVGCPLLVHRRCISPMFDISNRISYNGIMKQKTLPPSAEKMSSFLFSKSKWINVGGAEEGGGNHFVQEQGENICCMINNAFENVPYPDMYIISPFTSVVCGIRNLLVAYAKKNKDAALGKSSVLGEWLYSNIGTVHKFQGKEANEVILVLGCDETVKEKYAVKGFVNSNIVNVAATRAKYRFYVVGDIKVWCNNEYINTAKSIIDNT